MGFHGKEWDGIGRNEIFHEGVEGYGKEWDGNP